MKNRRGFLLMLTTSFVALGLVVGTTLADELFGVITKVDADAKKITVVEKESGKEIEVTVKDDTEVVTKKGSNPVDLEKLAKGVERAKEKGNKGISVKVEHEKAVASKIHYVGKKAAAKSN
ncbi:hypothetical protein [Singulisphaera sp. PoT]|uniref:hypothetical protein n=1 Tax=Singulisphaera sp. PoT TaxID=3411797 RepID=UPI003BF4CC6A